jgi:hypothetical protein
MGKIKGIIQAKKKLASLVGDIQDRKAVRAMTRALIIGGGQAAVYTPIDTSTLINSQFREIDVRGHRLVGRVGYSAKYAIYVHDPKIKQTFRRPSAKKEFLTKGFEDTKSMIDRAVAEEMKI